MLPHFHISRLLRFLLTLGGCILLPGTLRAADHPVIPLWPEGVPGLRADAAEEKLENTSVTNVHRPTLTLFAPARPNGTAVIVCPGGGYNHLSIENEGSLIAQRFNAMGVTVFVLHYRLNEYGHPAPLRDVLRAVRLVRSRCAEFGLAANRLGVLGASAGGHLAACAGTLFAHPAGKTGAPLDAVNARPDFLIMQYPVILMEGPKVHRGSRDSLLGPHPTPELVNLLSVDRQVTAQTPPSFLVATAEDTSVPLENAQSFYTALRQVGVPAELHLYEKGPHGFSMHPDLGPTSQWPQRAEEWMRSHGWLPAKP